MRIIIGLGNPGSQYRGTRHNAGFMVIDQLSDELGIAVTQSKFKGLVGEGRYQGEKVLLLKPLTYMNLSGEAVRAAIDWYKIDAKDIIVAYDDMDLEVGKIRFRAKGGSGGHNGMKSLIAHLGTETLSRCKIGVGRPVVGDVVSHVLTKFTEEEQVIIDQGIKKAVQGMKAFISSGDIIDVMNQFNG